MYRHAHDHGWILDDGSYLCDGCNVLGVHEHRCHIQADTGLSCSCEICREPTPEELTAFMKENEV